MDEDMDEGASVEDKRRVRGSENGGWSWGKTENSRERNRRGQAWRVASGRLAAWAVGEHRPTEKTFSMEQVLNQ